ncbi:MAG: acetylglutamate kinase [Acidobacteria bacterium]|nr:acetylglutamate kinase [Acidobacteriota bacterium]
MNLAARRRVNPSGHAAARPVVAPGAPCVLKIGGDLLEDSRKRRALVGGVVRTRAHLPLVVIHGGGAQVSRVAEKLGLKPTFRQGLRVTDEPMAEVAEMVLSGQVNKALVATLVQEGVPAIGLSGKDLGLVEAVAVPGLGRVGVPLRVRAERLWELLALGYTPVLASIAADARGQTLNINADHLAAAVAGAIGARHLLLLSSSGGVRRDPDNRRSSLVRMLSTLEVEARIALGALTRGMIPKVRAAKRALEQGVERVGILAPGSAAELSGALRHGKGKGTWIVRGPETLPRKSKTLRLSSPTRRKRGGPGTAPAKEGV